MALIRLEGEPLAQAVHRAVSAAMAILEEVAYDRATDPTLYPILPSGKLAEHFTRKLLADLLEAGLEPEGWQEHYFHERRP